MYNPSLLKLIDRLVLMELRGPFLFGVAMFSMLSIVTVVLQDALKFIIKYQLDPRILLKMLALASPEFIVLSIPMGVLLGTLISVGRLNSDNEVIALRAAGVSLYRMLLPYLLVGFMLSAVTFVGWEYIVPYTGSTLHQLRSNIQQGKEGEAKQERAVVPIYMGGDVRWLLLANEIRGNEMTGVRLFYFDPKDQNKDFSIQADRARWEGRNWSFYETRFLGLQPAATESEQIELKNRFLKISDFDFTPESLALKSRTAEDLPSFRLRQYINEVRTNSDSSDDRDIPELYTQLYAKFALPLAPLFFIFIAVPLAIAPQRSSTTRGMGFALLIVLVYYVLFTTFQKLGASGTLPPLLAAWGPNAIILGVGLWLLNKRQRV